MSAEPVGSSLGKTSLISGGLALFFGLFFVLLQSLLIGPLAFLILASGLGLLLAPIAIFTGLTGIRSDDRKLYSIVGLLMGVFIVMYHFMALTPLFTWIPI